MLQPMGSGRSPGQRPRPRRSCNSHSATWLDCQCSRSVQSAKESHSTRECSGDNLIRRLPASTAKQYSGITSRSRWPVALRTKVVCRNGRNRLQLKILGALRDSCFLFGFPLRGLEPAFASATAACDELPDTGICAKECRVLDMRCNMAIGNNQNLKRHPVAIAEVSRIGHRFPVWRRDHRYRNIIDLTSLSAIDPAIRDR